MQEPKSPAAKLWRTKLWRTTRRMRRILYVSLSQEMWRRRLVFLAGAVVVGVVSVGFAKGADGAQDIYSHLFAKWPWLPLIMTPLGFAIIAATTHRWFPAATVLPKIRKSVIPAFRLFSRRIPERPPARILLTCLAITSTAAPWAVIAIVRLFPLPLALIAAMAIWKRQKNAKAIILALIPAIILVMPADP